MLDLPLFVYSIYINIFPSFSLAHRSSIAMFISEIPVRCQGEKTIRWIGDLNHRTTVRDIIRIGFTNV